MNLTMRSTEQYTDMFTYVGRRDVWRAFGDVFRHQVRDRPMRDPAFVKEVGGDTAYFYPGFTEDEDPLHRVLASVPGANARIRISMYAWLLLLPATMQLMGNWNWWPSRRNKTDE